MSRFTDEHKGMLADTAAYIIFGFSYLFSKMAMNVTEPLILLLARFTTTFLVLNLLVLTGVCKIHLKGKSLLAPILVGILQPCLYFVFENYGLAYTTTSFTGMISSLSPIFTTILGALILKEVPNWKQWLFIAVSICGVLMVSLGGSGGENTITGCLCLIAAYFLGSFYSLTVRHCSDRFTPFELTYVMFTVAFVFFTVLTFGTYRGETLPMLTEALGHGQFILSVVYLGIGASVIAYFLANYALARLPVARATIFANLSTVVSVAAGVVLMGDPFTWVSAAAFVLILCGIAGVNKFKTDV
ncbi:MAG: DMT family transporter [Clostridia bacterium]|nr:DMT family transporter [Clostridia bacterium]